MRFFRTLLGRRSAPAATPEDPHAFSQEYWKSCSDSFLGGDDYYQAVESSLRRDILPIMRPASRILDVGCGNGRYTLMFASACPDGKVTAFDLSPELIAQAKRRAEAESVTNAVFTTQDCLKPGVLSGLYDWVLCMGVAATIIDDTACQALMSAACERVDRGGYLLLRESMSMTDKPISVNQPNYCARYRTFEQFAALTGDFGLQLAARHPLKKWVDEGTINEFLLFQRPC